MPSGTHGTLTAYNRGCRCAECRAAKSTWYRGYAKDRALHRPRLVDATGTVRRAQALIAIGWTQQDLAPRFGWKKVLPFLYGRKKVPRATAERMRQVYAELSMTPGPSRWARTFAARRGWASPLAWDDIDDPAVSPTTARSAGQRSAHSSSSFVDPVAVERALTGDRVRLTRAERAEVVHRIVERGQGVARVCQLLPVSNATAQRLVNDARRETRVSSAKVAS